MADTSKIDLTPIQQKFILHWGEMGQAWGINRTMAQVHALARESGTCGWV